jgi:voltage-gated potassium channel
MFGLALLFLALVAGILYSHKAYVPTHSSAIDGPDDSEVVAFNWDFAEVRVLVYGIVFLWPAFIVEALWSFRIRDRSRGFWRPMAWAASIIIVPPLRIAGRPGESDIWLPRLGWQEPDRELRRQLERVFGAPMIVIALMVLPVLAIEFGWQAQIDQYPALRLFVEIANSTIWFAFMVEFVLMCAVAENKIRYAALHWVDLAIILLPVVYFALYVLPQILVQITPLARSLRILRLSQLSRMSRIYRMQGLALKAWRAFLVLEVVQRLSGRTLEKQLKQAEELLQAKEDEMDDIRQEIADLKKRIAVEKSKTRPATH